jgi:SAM-dependent methyltransferase
MKNTERFSNRVADYVRYRPDYPVEVVRHLEQEGLLFDGAVVADVGAGTGIFSTLLLDQGYEVYAIEPNAPMRQAAEEALGTRPRYHCVAGTAEATTLPDKSVDLVTAAQSLHWFDPSASRAEFARITRAPHRLAAIWNRRDITSTPFLREYERLLQEYGLGYTELMQGRDQLESSLAPFFGHDDYQVFVTSNPKAHDWDGLVGRLLSSSYGPKPDHPSHEPLMRQLRAAFEANAVDDQIAMLYETRVYYGEISSG